jgi:hypothetical protein
VTGRRLAADSETTLDHDFKFSVYTAREGPLLVEDRDTVTDSVTDRDCHGHPGRDGEARGRGRWVTSITPCLPNYGPKNWTGGRPGRPWVCWPSAEGSEAQPSAR